MLFSELYSSYYNTVAKILKTAVNHPLGKNELRQMIEENAFEESILNIEPALTEERWQLLTKDGLATLKNVPTLPLTELQKRWLKSISLDPRVKLFDVSFPELSEMEPLFTLDDYCVFDRYSDGDPYEDENYRKHFKIILDAIKNRVPLCINTTNRKNNGISFVVMPEYLEYSEKDDKFRLIGFGNRYGETINLGRIVSCEPYNKPFDASLTQIYQPKLKTLEFELTNRRNALERVLLHFAHFEKEAEKIEDGKYLVKITYDQDDETELVVRVLSFGPMIKVLSPQSFVDLIKQRLIDQKSCEQ